jgi:FO synthase
MHAVARLVLHPVISNIQTSWVKMGREGALWCLGSGANDLGGSLMNETITRSAGASHGEEVPPKEMDSLIQRIGRRPLQRTTLYAPAPKHRIEASYTSEPLRPTVNTPAREFHVDPLAEHRSYAKTPRS